MFAITKWTVKQRKVSTIWWTVGISGFILLNMVFYPTFKDQAAELEKSFQSLPDAALQLFGGSADFFSPVGFMNSQIFFLMLPLLLSMLAVSLGASLLARDEQDLTIEPLLARPISRGRLLSERMFSGLLILGVVTIGVLLVTIIAVKLVDIDLSVTYIALATLNCFLLALTTGAIAFVLTATGKARGAAVGLAALIGVGGYIISSLSVTVSWLKAPSNVLPFDYYQSEAILRGTYNWVNSLFFVVIILACCAISYLAFRRRDIG